MANRIEVDVNAVKSKAERIATINKTIRSDFQDVEQAIRSLNGSWNSQAGDAVIRHFSSIKNAYYDQRFQVMADYSKFLLTQVSAGYTETESKNVSLADAFK
ncbi:hypothetical protein A8F94_07395 [Bacillus sp. FJAT-27225]|uniref:WXG100 family type VII secretion target n=1 Tax=Bacillus sp. FJAT-27225 TaxID=1743144 RepID=UPI00080C2253|nr:WXG100 family type VII secretion target [Bacillus sp. FJAT-27225]OCA87671.1 hypothetical protein A8F94_07395 [Bacillus sp. FJAT-27225]